MKDFGIYLLLLAGSTYFIRAIPFAAVKKKIENRFIKSFLYYIPYTVLAAMTLPGALYATGSVASAAVGIAVAVLFALKGKGLTAVATAACAGVLAAQVIMNLI